MDSYKKKYSKHSSWKQENDKQKKSVLYRTNAGESAAAAATRFSGCRSDMQTVADIKASAISCTFYGIPLAIEARPTRPAGNAPQMSQNLFVSSDDR